MEGQEYLQKLKLGLEKTIGVDYADIRLGESVGTMIGIRNKRVEEVSRPRSFGGSVRVLHKGGWGFATFNDVNAVPDAIGKAKNFAKMIGNTRSQLAKVKVVKDNVVVGGKDRYFERVGLKEKVGLLKHYDDLAWKMGQKLVNVDVSYMDAMKKVVFVSSEGVELAQEKAYVYSMMVVAAKEKDVVQRYSLKLSDRDYETIFDKEAEVERAVKMAEKIARASKVIPGTYTVIIDPKLAGVFAHEAFGHLSEGDNTYENQQLRSVMTFGKRFGSEILSIVDDPTRSGMRGSFKYDDEGVRSEKVVLLDKGILSGRLHSRETAGKMGEMPNGHGRAQSAGVKPLVRMGITYIEPGQSTFEEMLAGVKHGLYCVSWQAGNTDHENFTFTAGYGVEIENGKLGAVVRDVKLTGSLFETLKNVDMVGFDLEFEGGSCGKMGQYVPENSGGPHVRIKDVVVI